MMSNLLTLPANRMDVRIQDQHFYASEVRQFVTLHPDKFDTLDALISHIKQYAGIVHAPTELWSDLQSAGILLVREK